VSDSENTLAYNGTEPIASVKCFMVKAVAESLILQSWQYQNKMGFHCRKVRTTESQEKDTLSLNLTMSVALASPYFPVMKTPFVLISP